MRYLNKIVFINSAHIPYAEIMLDGNVHFIGTQGVGKSTLLRAILFFYNVDKGKLGIRTQDKQKSYDEFYLPFPNSYIIYEVCRETGPFFVMSFSRGRRTAFRIVDCPYDRSFFMGSDGEVAYEWGRISERIGARTFKSGVIRSCEDLRDIIYGNSQKVDKELRRFSLMESTKYQNVPRTIQNIFLNQSLESRVIKDTIIDSMDFADDGIDLGFYREQVKDFRQQYEDIWKWFKTERNGKVKVRTDAENVTSRYMLYDCVRRDITELCANLGYALERDEARLPGLEDCEKDCKDKLARQNRLLDEEKGKYHAERDKLNKEDGALEAFLKTVKARRRHYDEIGIDGIAEKMGKEGELKIRKETLKREMEALTGENKNVKWKYDALLQVVDAGLREYEIAAEQRINDIERKFTDKKAELRTELDEKLDAVKLEYRLKFDENHEKANNLMQVKADLMLSEQKVSQDNPYREEIEELTRRKAELQGRKSRLELDSKEKQHEIDKITADVELHRKDLESECKMDVAQIERERCGVLEEISKCDALLERLKGSFVEWLGNNVEGWDEGIGRVVDAEAVLYNTSLNPRLADASNTVYGIMIDVDSIDKTVETPEEIRSRKAILEQRAERLRKLIVEKNEKLRTDIEELERKPSARLKTLRQEKMKIDSEHSGIPVKIANTERKKKKKEDRLKEWRTTRTEDLKTQRRRTEQELDELKRQKTDYVKQQEKELNALREASKRAVGEAEKDAERKKKIIKGEMQAERHKATKRKGELEAHCDAELKGLGVDMERLGCLRRQLETVESELDFIDAHRDEFISWQNDSKNYFNLEQEKKDGRAKVRKRLDDLQEKFGERERKRREEINRLSTELRTVQEELEKISESIRRTKAFMAASSCPQEMQTAGRSETVKPLAEILDKLRDCVADKQRRMEDFKQAVTVFKNNFSPQNTFHFRTELNTEADYEEFAAGLNDFLVNKKIDEYRTRTSAQYATIIRRIAKEVGDLDAHNADVRTTINDINKDFRDNNFAGVIKDIELRAVDSNDRLMQHLLNIRKFSDDNAFNMGELDLFTNEDNLERTNRHAVDLLMGLIDIMDAERKREKITLSDTFKLEFKVKENDNDTNWVEKLSSVGSDGTDILVKAMVNIMLINVFKRKISRKFGDFKLHCMMDEIGKLHPNNVEGILKFANVRNIFLVNSSPTTYNAQAYKYTYMLSKDAKSNTVVKKLLTIR